MWQSLHDGVVCHAATRLSLPHVATLDVVILVCQQKELHSGHLAAQTGLPKLSWGCVPCTQGLLHAGVLLLAVKAAAQAWFLSGGLCFTDCYTCLD